MAIKIYIDQGHNPQNPNAGAEGNGYREQDISYDIGVRLADILNDAGLETRLSRNDPAEVLGTSNQSSLSARVNDANAWGADYFISLHTNAAASPQASGSEALVYSLGTRAAALGESILDDLTDETGLADRGVIARPGLYVLRRTRMPAVLVEMGFITNRRDAELMATSPELFARGIADGILDYLGLPTLRRTVEDVETSIEYAVSADVATLPPPDDSDSATDREDEPDNEESYTEFIGENPATGYLKVQAFRQDQVYPVSGVEVIITRKFPDGERVFFAGVTDEDGIIDLIPLPAPERQAVPSPSDPETAAIYDLIATHPQYETINRKVTVFGGVRAVQPLVMNIS